VKVPEDVLQFLRELERRGIRIEQVSVERTPMPRDTYDVWEVKEGEYRYRGVLSGDEAYKPRTHVVCGRLTCSLFQDRVLTLAFDRELRKVYEPEEV
jgi:hypothetical protein